MFEREIRYITDYTLNSLKKLGSFFTFQGLSQSRIHPAILQYISAELDYLIFLDRQRLLQKSLFDYSGAEIARHFSYIAQEIKKNKLIPFEDARRLVQQAVTYNVNFLLRPRWSLRQFVYDTEEYRSAEELKLLMNYSYFYDYYKQFINRYIERKNVQSLSLHEYSEKINVITQELLTSQFDAIISSGLDDAAAFFNMGDAIKNRLSVEMIEMFLKDRKLEHQIVKIRQGLSVDPKQKFEVDEFKKIILGDQDQLRIFDFDDAQESTQAEPAVTLAEQAKVSVELQDGLATPELDLDEFLDDVPVTEDGSLDAAPGLVADSQPVLLTSEEYTDMLNDVLTGETSVIRDFTLAQKPVLRKEPEPVEADAAAEEQLPEDESDESTQPLNTIMLEEIRNSLNNTVMPLEEALTTQEQSEVNSDTNAGIELPDVIENSEQAAFEEEILSISLPDEFELLQDDHATVELNSSMLNDTAAEVVPVSEEAETAVVGSEEEISPEHFLEMLVNEHIATEQDVIAPEFAEEILNTAAAAEFEALQQEAGETASAEDESTDAAIFPDVLESAAEPVEEAAPEIADTPSEELDEFEALLTEETVPQQNSELAAEAVIDSIETADDDGAEQALDELLEHFGSEPEPEATAEPEVLFEIEDEGAVPEFDELLEIAEELEEPELVLPEDEIIELPEEEIPAEMPEAVQEAAETEPVPEAVVSEQEEEVESELFGYFTTKETMRIVGSVFRNDSIDFVNTIERIAACADFDEANDILRSVFFAYKVDPVTDREAKLLMDRVTMFFEK